MKILFVEKKLRADKLGICYLAALLKKAGHEVDLVQDDLENADKYLVESPADFVMYSVMSSEANWVLKRNQELKAKHDFVSVVGGPDPTFMPPRWVDDKAIDFVVQGPGESVVLNIINGSAQRLSRGNLLGSFEYFSPDRNIIYKYDELGKSGMKRFMAGRYCLFSCVYCFNHAFKKIFQDQKSCFTYRPLPEIMFQEIMEVKDKHGLELAYFNDDDLAADPNWITKFCELMISAGTPVNFGGSIRATSINEKMVKMMASAKCRFINIALESANAETQKFLRRGGITSDDAYRAVRWCETAGIRVRLQNMIGLPVADPMTDALETFEFNKKCRPTESWAGIYQPLPGTELCAYCVEKGLVSRDAQPVGFFDKTILKIKDPEKINRLGKYWFWAVKEKWPLELLKEKLNEPVSDEAMEAMTQARFAASKKDFFGV